LRELQGRVAVVTGAASGIGRATAEALAVRGCDLALVDVDPTGLAESAEEVRRAGRRASRHAVDVADRAAMARLPEAVVAEHGHVHVLVNNAGVAVSAPLEEHGLEDFDWIVGVNLFGVVHGCRFFLPWLRREEEAHIVNVSSMFGFLGFPGQGSYCATKAAVRALSEALAGELHGSRIGVTSVHPGAIRSNLVRRARTSRPEASARAQARFERMARPPELVARRIVRAIERGRPRVVVCPEAHLADWAKRLAPVLTQRLAALYYRRFGPIG
jgi:NAD(P)-dependent dehydrogenase (short-subunit alcohol dehydrogenase family)